MCLTTYFYVPQNLDLDKLIEENASIFVMKKDRLLYLLDFIVTKSYVVQKDIISTKKRNYIEISSQDFKRKGFYDYYIYLRLLEQNNIIESDGTYFKSQKCKGYRLTEKYLTCIESISIERTKIIDKIITKSTKIIDQKYLGLYKCLIELNIDYDEAIKELSNTNKRNINSYNKNKISIDKIQEKKFYFNIDKTSGRLHSNLTNLSSTFRKHIDYKGKRLVNIDIKNSQPLISSILFNNIIYTYLYNIRDEIKETSINKVIKRIYKYLLKDINKIMCIFMCQKLELLIDTEDVRNYCRLVLNGGIYEYFSEQLFLKNNEEISRDEAKKKFYVVIYGRNMGNSKNPNRYKKLFSELFPNVYKIFRILKSHNYKFLALLLQTVESALILDCICLRILAEKKDIPLFTIHDSIVTTVENEAYVRKVMIEEIRNVLGVEPILKSEYW